MFQPNHSEFDIISEVAQSDFQSVNSASSSTNPFNNTNVSHVAQATKSSDIDRLICALQSVPFNNNNDIKDIRHIDSFSGSGEQISVISKLKTLLCDFEEFFQLRNLPEIQKLILLKQKCTGQAKDIINHHRPSTYASAKLLLTQAFGQIDLDSEKALEILKSMKLRPNEKLRQFIMRLNQCAEIVADKLECSTYDKIIFDALVNTFMKNFQPYIAVQSNIVQAKKNKDFETLCNIVLELSESNPEIFKTNETSSKINQPESKRQIVCSYCKKAGHSRNFCYALYPQKYNVARRSADEPSSVTSPQENPKWTPTEKQVFH